MSINWDLYENRINITGITQRDQNISQLKSNITNYIVDSPSFVQATINGEEQNIIVTEIRSSSYNTTKKKILSLPDESFNIGDIVEINNVAWLVTDCDYNDPIQTKGIIEQCNYTISFQKNDATIISYPIIFKSNTASLDQNDMITTIDHKIQIKLKFDSVTETNLVTGKRLIIDNRTSVDNPNVYIISNVDSVSQSYLNYGVMIIMLEKDTYDNNNDRKDLGVCNYFSIDQSMSSNETTITFIDQAELKQGNVVYKNFTAVFPVHGLSPIWSNNLSDEFKTYISTVEDGNVIKIKVLDGNNGMLNHTFRLSVSDNSEQGYVAYVDIKIIPLY